MMPRQLLPVLFYVPRYVATASHFDEKEGLRVGRLFLSRTCAAGVPCGRSKLCTIQYIPVRACVRIEHDMGQYEASSSSSCSLHSKYVMKVKPKNDPSPCILNQPDWTMKAYEPSRPESSEPVSCTHNTQHIGRGLPCEPGIIK